MKLAICVACQCRNMNRIAIGLTLNVVLSVRFLGLVVVYQLHDVQEVILAESLQTLCQLLHVDLLWQLLATRETWAHKRTYSLGCLLPLLGLSSTIGIADGTRIPQSVNQFGLRVAECLARNSQF
jgi:hypothetical protein